jgi:tetratricopeptide (TPR) repeat protein
MSLRLEAETTENYWRDYLSDANGLYNKGTDCFHKGKYDKAIKLLKQSININPTKEAHLNMGAAYKQIGDLKKALVCFETSLKLDNNYALALNNVGLIHHMWNREETAFDYFEKALTVDPDYADAGWNRALSVLKRACSGNLDLFKDGWMGYEWRFHKSTPVELSHTDKPRWLGETDGTVLVMTEQGIGDNIMFMRYLPYIADHVKIIIQVPDTLKVFFSGYETTNTSEIPHDYYVPICSLGAYFNEIPYGKYLNYTGELDSNLAGGIGIVWKGNPNHGNDANRSSYENMFKRFEKYGKLFSLQYGIKPKIAEPINIESWEDTIKYIASLDAVITIDSSIAHVAGALGKKVFILVPGIDTDFRWGLTGDTSIWYENATLIRNMNFDDCERKVAEWRTQQA